jgi:orotate phosphoribosyltransferase
MKEQNYWAGEFVQQALHLELPETSENSLNFKDVAGLALRDNPKRAHLIVSKLLGKHYPQSPYLIQASAMILANMVHAKANGSEYDEAGTALDLLKEALNDEDIAETLFGYLSKTTNTATGKSTVCFGYAETATGLGAGIADHLNAHYYIHSTRYPDAAATNYGFFEEEHSHATQHHITPDDAFYLDNQESAVVLVDDEITTGKTVMNTVKMLEAKAHHNTYIIASLIDSRSDEAIDRMNSFASKLNVNLHVVSLFQGHLNIPDNVLATAATIVTSLKELEAEQPTTGTKPVAEVKHVHCSVHIKELKNGVTEFESMHELAKEAAAMLASEIKGRTLMLGVEEDMYFPLLVGAELGSTGIVYSTTTRSPALGLNEKAYALQSKIVYEAAHPGVSAVENIRYAYNLKGRFDTIILLGTLTDQATWGKLIPELSKITTKIIVGDLIND